MTIRLHTVNFKQLHARQPAVQLGVVDVAQQLALLLCYVTTAAVSGVLRNPRTVIHYARYAMLGHR